MSVNQFSKGGTAYRSTAWIPYADWVKLTPAQKFKALRKQNQFRKRSYYTKSRVGRRTYRRTYTKRPRTNYVQHNLGMLSGMSDNYSGAELKWAMALTNPFDPMATGAKICSGSDQKSSSVTIEFHASYTLPATAQGFAVVQLHPRWGPGHMPVLYYCHQNGAGGTGKAFDYTGYVQCVQQGWFTALGNAGTKGAFSVVGAGLRMWNVSANQDQQGILQGGECTSVIQTAVATWETFDQVEATLKGQIFTESKVGMTTRWRPGDLSEAMDRKPFPVGGASYSNNGITDLPTILVSGAHEQTFFISGQVILEWFPADQRADPNINAIPPSAKPLEIIQASNQCPYVSEGHSFMDGLNSAWNFVKKAATVAGKVAMPVLGIGQALGSKYSLTSYGINRH